MNFARCTFLKYNNVTNTNFVQTNEQTLLYGHIPPDRWNFHNSQETICTFVYRDRVRREVQWGQSSIFFLYWGESVIFLQKKKFIVGSIDPTCLYVTPPMLVHISVQIQMYTLITCSYTNTNVF